ncbi:MAG: hypothetical protein AB2A00_07415 [Myxococcota bacterium]
MSDVAVMTPVSQGNAAPGLTGGLALPATQDVLERPTVPALPVLRRACQRGVSALLRPQGSAWCWEATPRSLLFEGGCWWLELQWLPEGFSKHLDGRVSLSLMLPHRGYMTPPQRVRRGVRDDVILMEVPSRLMRAPRRRELRRDVAARRELVCLLQPLRGGEREILSVLDVSAHGLLLECPFSAMGWRPGDLATGALIADGKTVLEMNAQVVYRLPVIRRNGDRIWRLGITFRDCNGMTPRQSGAPVGWDPAAELVSQPAEVQRLLRACERTGMHAVLRINGEDVPGSMVIAGADLSPGLWFVPSRRGMRPTTVDAQLEFSLYATSLVGPTRVLRLHQGWLELSTPPFLQRVVRRRQRRLAPAQDGRVKVDHPVLGRRSYRLRDVSWEGLSMQQEEGRAELVRPGMTMRNLRVQAEGTVVRIPTAQVRSVDGNRVGLEFGPLGASQESDLTTLLLKLGHPDVEHPRADEAGWLLDFYLERAAGGLRGDYWIRRRDDVKRTWERLFARPSNVYRTLVMRHRGEIAISSAYVQAYDHTLLGQHMVAAVRGMKAPVRQLVAAQFEMFDWSHMRWQLAVLHRHNKGSNALFQPGAQTSSRWYARRDVDIYALPNPANVPEPQPTAGVSVTSLQEADEPQVARWIRAMEGDAWADVESVHPGQMHLRRTARAYQRLGLMREREWLVLSEHGEVAAAVSVQRATVGLAYSQLLSTGRLYVLSPRASQAGLRQLIRAAVKWYRDHDEEMVWWLTARPEERAALEAEGFLHNDACVALAVHRNCFQAYQHGLAQEMGAGLGMSALDGNGRSES